MKTALIVFGEDWGRHPSSTQHLIKHLCRERQIIWVNSVGLRFPKFTFHDLKRVWEKLGRLFGKRGVRSSDSDSELPENLQVVNPWVLPPARHFLVRWFNRFSLTRQINRVCDAQKITTRDLWLSLPSAVDYVGHLQESKVIYYCGDDFSELAGVDHDFVSECEVALMNKAHHVLVASQALWTKFAGIQDWLEKLVLLEHGVDVELFTSPCPPAEVTQGERPIAGFYGSIADWLDLALLAKAAKALPNWRFVLIGQVETDISLIENLANVEIYPAVPHQELPRYAQHWQASLLPFRDCGQIQACNPLKLKEYLACGRPVISTPFPAVDQYRQVVDIVRNTHELIEAIQRCQSSHLANDYQQAKQRASVAHESWEMKAFQVNELLAATAAKPITEFRSTARLEAAH